MIAPLLVGLFLFLSLTLVSAQEANTVLAQQSIAQTKTSSIESSIETTVETSDPKNDLRYDFYSESYSTNADWRAQPFPAWVVAKVHRSALSGYAAVPTPRPGRRAAYCARR